MNRTSAGLLAGSLGALALFVSAQPAAADGVQRQDREAVAELIHCYARGTDAIGDSTTNADPKAEGLSIYHKCFAPDAQFRAWFPQQPFDSQTFPNPDAFPATAPAPFVGPAAWADWLFGRFSWSNHGLGHVHQQQADLSSWFLPIDECSHSSPISRSLPSYFAFTIRGKIW